MHAPHSQKASEEGGSEAGLQDVQDVAGGGRRGEKALGREGGANKPHGELQEGMPESLREWIQDVSTDVLTGALRDFAALFLPAAAAGEECGEGEWRHEEAEEEIGIARRVAGLDM